MAGDVLGEGASNEARTNALAFLRRGLEREEAFAGEPLSTPMQPDDEPIGPSPEDLIGMLQTIAAMAARRNDETQVVTRPDGTAARVPIIKSPRQTSRVLRSEDASGRGTLRATNRPGTNPGEEEQFFEGSEEFAQQRQLEELIQLLLGRGPAQ